MVEIRVVVPDAAEADGLLARLAPLFDRLELSVDGTRNEDGRAESRPAARPRCGHRRTRRVILGIPVWGLWTIAAALLAIGEVLTPGLFFLGPLAVVAVFPALLAAVATGLLQAGDQVEVGTDRGRHGARPTLNRRNPWSP
jgi:hypothetical protein